MIMKGRAPLRLPAGGLVTLALLSAATLPTWAAGTETQAPATPAIAVIGEPPVPIRVAVTLFPPYQPPQAVPPPPPAQAAPKTPPPPPPPPAQATASQPQEIEKVVKPFPNKTVYILKTKSALPEDGKQLLEAFERDVEEIQREVQLKTEARREALVKELEALQEKYTKAGQLDEAIAVRNYLRSGQPGKYFIVRQSLMKR